MEKITAQEALHRLAERYKEKILNNERKNLIGLDINDYASVFRRGSEVTILEYYQEEDSLAGRTSWRLLLVCWAKASTSTGTLTMRKRPHTR